MEDGDIHGLGSSDRRNADKSGAEMKQGGDTELGVCGSIRLFAAK